MIVTGDNLNSGYEINNAVNFDLNILRANGDRIKLLRSSEITLLLDDPTLDGDYIYDPYLILASARLLTGSDINLDSYISLYADNSNIFHVQPIINWYSVGSLEAYYITITIGFVFYDGSNHVLNFSL